MKISDTDRNVISVLVDRVNLPPPTFNYKYHRDRKALTLAWPDLKLGVICAEPNYLD